MGENSKQVIDSLLNSMTDYIQKIKNDAKPGTKPFKCAVVSCNNVYDKHYVEKKERLYKFHKFPVDCTVANKWKESCGLPAEAETDSVMVCSDHFNLDDYERNYKEEFKDPNYRRPLKEKAVPSLKLSSCVKRNSDEEVDSKENVLREIEKKGVKRGKQDESEEVDSKEIVLREIEKKGINRGKQDEREEVDLKEIGPREIEKKEIKRLKQDEREEVDLKEIGLQKIEKKGVKRGKRDEREEVDSKEDVLREIEKKGIKRGKQDENPESELKKALLKKPKIALNPALKEKEQMLSQKLASLKMEIKKANGNLYYFNKQIEKLQSETREKETSRQSGLYRVFSDAQISILKGEKKVVWSDDDLAMAFTLRHMSSKECYLYLKYTLNMPLPALACVQKWAACKSD